MADALVTGTDIEQYLPQRPPMIMVDTLWSYTEGEIVSGLVIDAGNLFVSEGRFTEPGLLENVAQTAALGGGYEALHGGEEVKIGYIGAFKDIQIHRIPEVGEILKTKLSNMQKVWNCTSYEAIVMSREETLATMEIKLFVL